MMEGLIYNHIQCSKDSMTSEPQKFLEVIEQYRRRFKTNLWYIQPRGMSLC